MSDLKSLMDDTPEPEIPTTHNEVVDAMIEEVLRPGNIGSLEVQTAAEQAFNFNILIYGKSGVGKTRLAGSAAAVPEMSPVLFVDIEGGTFTIRDIYPDAHVVRVTSWPDLQIVYEALFDEETPYRTVVLDSLTEIMKFNMYAIMQGVVKKEAERDPDIPSVREWGKNIEQLRKFIRAFRDLPINTIFTALSTEEKNQKTGATEKKIALNGKLSLEAAGFLDIVVYMYTKMVGDPPINKRLLLSTATEDVIAKDRSNKLPPVLEFPTMQDIYDIVSGRRSVD